MKKILLPTLTLILLCFACSDNDINEGEKRAQKKNEPKENSSLDTDTTDSVSDEARVKEKNNFEFSAYINDPDPQGKTNIRTGPDRTVYKVLNTARNTYMLDLGQYKDGWFKIKKIYEEGQETKDTANMWIHASVLEVSSRNYGPEMIEIYKSADKDSEIIASFEEVITMRPLAIDGNWVKIQYHIEEKIVEGWVRKENLCGNPYTTCS